MKPVIFMGKASDIAIGILVFTLAAFHAHAENSNAPNLTTSTGKPFTSMTVPADDFGECRAERPPNHLAKTAYIRNGYRAILRIMAAEAWQKTGSCACFLTTLTWGEVVLEAQNYITSDNPLLPFKVADLRIRADQMQALRDAACKN
jgi:hypothetical protein